jgi:hypothetical protein
MTSNEIKAARSKASQSNPTSALADSGGFLDDSVLAAIRPPSAGRQAGPVRNRPHHGRQAPPKHASG